MNSSTLRRLARDHAALHTADLPPHYLFLPTGSASSTSEDLTQLTILLTGPQGTPYSQGIWKLCLKIPEDYPRSPPKALFRTRIWHPNVEEQTGSVCVDTLKKDWDPKLTLRDVLITISCLLIQPNPDSALNATAGHLLQDDYDSFFRQAWLMTSIHASIPLDLREAALTAKTRGEESDNMIPEDTQQRPALKCKAAGSSSVVVKKLPQRITSTQPSLLPLSTNQREEESASDEDETSGSKENDPILSPDPVPAQMPRRPMLTKRPLSDLPIPTDAESENIDAPYVSPFDQNVVNNKALTQAIAPVESSRKSPPTAERIQSIHSTGRGLQDTDANSLTVSPFMEPAYNDISRPTKRIRSEESKENIAEGLSLEMSSETSVLTASGQLKAVITAPRKDAASAAPGTSGMKGKSRAGLRRL